MILKISLILIFVFICRVKSSCTNITNEDKIDCVQHESWTPESCVAKGCCYKAVSGFPSCYYSFGNKHEPRCAISSGRRDCGNGGTTEIECIKSGCCWDMKPGPPFCYHAVEVVTEPTTVTESITENPETDSTVTDSNTDATDSPVTGTPGPDPTAKGRGAKVPFVEVEAEHAHHNGKVIGNDRHYGVLSSEASHRRAVQLNAVGQYVEFTMPINANSIVVRYSIPDTQGGKDNQVRNAPIDLLIDNHKLKALTFTSKYSWYYGAYPFNNQPGGQNPHHFYDEVRTMFDKTYPKGTKVKLQVTSIQQSPTFTIDLADFELVGAPHPKPAGSLSVTDATYGADPTGKTDSTKAIQKAVDDGKGQKKTVYIPKGTYLLYDHVIVDQVRIVGAGPWYTVLGGRNPNDKHKAAGIFGKYDADVPGGSKHVILENFAIIGDITERDDTAPTNALGGSFSDSVADNLWLQHVKCGGWFDGKMNNFTLKNSRILDTTADGVNFHKGVTNSVVENTFVRNTGDDGLAMWGEQYPNVNNKFIHNTVGIPILANNIAIYGGKDIEVSDNYVYDTITNGGGIHVSNRYANVRGETGIKGDYKIYRNTIVRAGNSDFNWHFGIGAIWFSGLNEEIHANIHVKDCEIIDASYSAISYVEGKVYGVVFENLFINGTGTFVLQLQSTGGEATFKNVKAVNVQQKNPIYNQLCHEPFKITVEGSKTGWYTDKPDCGSDSYIKAVVPKWPWNW